MQGTPPLHYVDVDDREFKDFPPLVDALAGGWDGPLVLVGGEVKSPPGISLYWVEDQLAGLGVAPFAVDGGGDV